MDIVFVSTFPPTKCGIATYCEDLATALIEEDSHVKITILAEGPPTPQTPQPRNDFAVYPIWQRGNIYNAPKGLSAIIRAIDSSTTKPDVVHIQHEFGLFPSNAGFRALLADLATRKIRTVVTLHTALLPPNQAGFFTDPPKCAYITHTLSQAALVPTSNVIPHGVKLQSKTTIAEQIAAKHKLQMPTECFVAVVPGFIGPGKGLEMILKAFTALKNHSMVIVGEARNEMYLDKLENLIETFGLDNVRIDATFSTPAVRHTYFQAADYVVLGAKDVEVPRLLPFSASGQLHTALGYGLPIIAKNAPIYRDANIFLYSDEIECAQFMQAATALKSECYNINRAIAESRTWKLAAQKHLAVYTSRNENVSSGLV